MTTTCDHNLGYIESNGYDGDTLTEFVHIEYLHLDTIKQLKSSNGCQFNFCPNCGVKLEGMLNDREQTLLNEKLQREKEEKLKQDKAKKIFLKKVEETSKVTKLNQLPEEGSFVVIFQPTKHSYGKNVVLTGPKDLILRNCVHYNQNKSVPDQLLVTNIYKVISQDYFESLLLNLNWTKKGSSSMYFEKTENNTQKQISLSSDGIIYLTNTHTDEEGYKNTTYDQFAINRLSEYLGVEVLLETITLT